MTAVPSSFINIRSTVVVAIAKHESCRGHTTATLTGDVERGACSELVYITFRIFIHVFMPYSDTVTRIRYFMPYSDTVTRIRYKNTLQIEFLGRKYVPEFPQAGHFFGYDCIYGSEKKQPIR
jgi:hypothetical protein